MDKWPLDDQARFPTTIGNMGSMPLISCTGERGSTAQHPGRRFQQIFHPLVRSPDGSRSQGKVKGKTRNMELHLAFFCGY